MGKHYTKEEQIENAESRREIFLTNEMLRIAQVLDRKYGVDVDLYYKDRNKFSWDSLENRLEWIDVKTGKPIPRPTYRGD